MDHCSASLQERGIDLSVVVPIFSEEKTIPLLLKKLNETIELLNKSYEIILVDDRSTDNSWQLIKSLKNKYPKLRSLRLSKRFGKESALLAGIFAAKGEIVITIDGDLQHPIELIPKLISLWNNGEVSIVEATRSMRPTESNLKRLLTKMYYKIFQSFTGLYLSNSTDFRLLDRSVVNTLTSLPERNLFLKGVVSWLGFKRKTIAFEPKERQHGKSGFTLFRLLNLSVLSLTAFSSAPLRIITLLGCFTAILSLALITQTLYIKFSGQALDGFTTVIICILIIGAVIMIALGIIGEYIARIFDEVKQRPQFIIDEEI